MTYDLPGFGSVTGPSCASPIPPLAPNSAPVRLRPVGSWVEITPDMRPISALIPAPKSTRSTVIRIGTLGLLLLALVSLGKTHAADAAGSAAPRSGNPVFPGWYADPEVAGFKQRYWIFPTFSAPYDQQLHFDAFSSADLVTWTKHERILDSTRVKWARRAMWAPAAVERQGRYYLFFGANDVHQGEVGGIGVAVADRPEGPYADLLGHPLVNEIVHGAQPIDQFVFQDKDGQDYLLYGGWSHCNIARLEPGFTALRPFPDGALFKEITPQNYVEGPCMFIRGGRYYFMWSEGGWTGPNYSVAYAIGDSPLGPFQRIGKILAQDPAVATGAGHHSVLRVPDTDEWYIVYHRRPLGETDANHRVTCIDRLEFDDQGHIKPVLITHAGVQRRPCPAP